MAIERMTYAQFVAEGQQLVARRNRNDPRDPATAAQQDRALAVRALEDWRRELAEGKRTKYDFDVLWRLACETQTALDLEHVLPRAAAEGFALVAAWCQRQPSGGKTR